jgi:hypothetical protein
MKVTDLAMRIRVCREDSRGGHRRRAGQSKRVANGAFLVVGGVVGKRVDGEWKSVVGEEVCNLEVRDCVRRVGAWLLFMVVVRRWWCLL